MTDSYRQRYLRNKEAVDKIMGRSLGFWGKTKALFSPNDSFSEKRKAAIEQVEYNAFPNTEQGRSDRLYRPENIIGTTSVKGQLPTVYYQSKRSNSYGHITQQHEILSNVGREPVRNDPTHTMQNEKGRLVERENGKKTHTSRNPFVPIQGEAQRAALSKVHLNAGIKDPKAIAAEVQAMRNKKI